MTANVRKCKNKADRLLRLYSLWHETKRDEIRREFLTLLREVLALNPRFNLRHEFQKAF